MAFLGMGKKKEQPKESSELPIESAGISADQVAAMMQQGYTNDQIVQALQQQGYSMPEISDAMNQAYSQYQQQDFGQGNYNHQYDVRQYPQQTAPQPKPEDGKVEEMVEAVIEEKWTEFSKDIKAIIEWKDRTEGKITQIQQQIADLKQDMDALKISVLGKVTEYDKNIIEVGTEIKAMEKVFQKVLPSLTESVNKLEKIAKVSAEQKK